MKKELVECLYIYMSEGISNLSDLINLFSFAAQGNAKDHIKLKTNLKNGKKDLSLTIGDNDKEDNKNELQEDPKKYKINDLCLFLELSVAGVGTAVVNAGAAAGSAAIGAGTAAIAKAIDTVTSTVTKITTNAEQKINKAVENGKDSLTNIKNEVETSIKDSLSSIADLDLFGMQYVPLTNGFGYDIGSVRLNFIKDVGSWGSEALLNGEYLNLDKIKNVVDIDTLNNINSISPQIYKDIVSSIMNDKDPEKTYKIIDCINEKTDEFKLAYEQLKDIEQAYEYANIDKDKIDIPDFDGKITWGILVLEDGTCITFSSGNANPMFSNYIPAAHAEGKAAIYMREKGIKHGVIFHNNTDGTCPYCNTMLPTLLDENSTFEGQFL